MVIQYLVYRNGHGNIEDRLRAALAYFYERYHCLPIEVVVNPSEVAGAKTALRALDLPRLAVQSVGGCLVPEVWLGVPGEENRTSES